ncbi:MAG: hypothetical protein ACKO0M_03275, partial [Cyanobium sp.]
MSWLRCAITVATCAAAGVFPPLWAAPGLGQSGLPSLPIPPPPLAPPQAPQLPTEPSAEEISRCVPSYGHTGCAARLYARLLCGVVGLSAMPEGL